MAGVVAASRWGVLKEVVGAATRLVYTTQPGSTTYGTVLNPQPALRSRVIVPDVLVQPHSASMQMTFYDGAQFPAGYRGDIFASEHGSWNRKLRSGYEVIHVPLHQTGHASGEYEDFLTGFVTPNGDVWGRPVGIAVAPDGALLVSDDGSESIWRVSYSGK